MMSVYCAEIDFARPCRVLWFHKNFISLSLGKVNGKNPELNDSKYIIFRRHIGITLAIRLFTQQLIEANINELIYTPHHWLFLRAMPTTLVQQYGRCFHAMTFSSWFTVVCGNIFTLYLTVLEAPPIMSFNYVCYVMLFIYWCRRFYSLFSNQVFCSI